MTLKESMALLAILREAYPRFYLGMTTESARSTAELWAEMLSDIGIDVARLALKRLIATCKFPPTIAEMRESVAAVLYVPTPDSGDAWGEVLAAIREYGYYRPEEALASLREPVRLVVQRMGWRELCISETGMADRAHFLRIYEAMTMRTQEQRLLPAPLRESIAAIGQKMPGIQKSLLAVIQEGA